MMICLLIMASESEWKLVRILDAIFHGFFRLFRSLKALIFLRFWFLERMLVFGNLLLCSDS